MARKRRSRTIPHDPLAEGLKVKEVERITRLGRKYIYEHLLVPGTKNKAAWIPVIKTGTRSIIIPRRGLMEAMALRTTQAVR